MMEMASIIEEAKRVYADAGLDCGHGLLPPADEAVVDVFGRELSLLVPSELRELYRVHGGQEYISPGVTGLFGQHRLHTPAEVIEHHRMFTDNCLFDPPPA